MLHSRWCLVTVPLLAVGTGGVAHAETPLRPYYKNDFILESADGAFQLKVRGNLHFDARAYQAEQRGSPHSFDIRRARIDLQGRVHQQITLRR